MRRIRQPHAPARRCGQLSHRLSSRRPVPPSVDILKKAKCDINPEVHVFVAAEIDADEREEEG